MNPFYHVCHGSRVNGFVGGCGLCNRAGFINAKS